MATLVYVSPGLGGDPWQSGRLVSRCFWFFFSGSEGSNPVEMFINVVLSPEEHLELEHLELELEQTQLVRHIWNSNV